MKVRVALGFKDIPYEFHSIAPRDRTEIVRLSGQHLTPVLLHADRVIFDSAAILRYLEANFRDRAPLFGASHAEQWAIEDLELFARATLAGPMTEIVHHRVSGGKIDDAMRARCAGEFAKATSTLIEALSGREWLVGDRMSAADVTAAAVIYRVRSSGVFALPADVAAIDGWVDKVMAFDRYLERPD
jgi:glutathione S-transferase